MQQGVVSDHQSQHQEYSFMKSVGRESRKGGGNHRGPCPSKEEGSLQSGARRCLKINTFLGSAAYACSAGDRLTWREGRREGGSVCVEKGGLGLSRGGEYFPLLAGLAR